MGVTPSAARRAASAIVASSSGRPTRCSSAAVALTTVGATLPRARLADRTVAVGPSPSRSEHRGQVDDGDGLCPPLAQLDEDATLAVPERRHLDGHQQLAGLEHRRAHAR